MPTCAEMLLVWFGKITHVKDFHSILPYQSSRLWFSGVCGRGVQHH